MSFSSALFTIYSPSGPAAQYIPKLQWLLSSQQQCTFNHAESSNSENSKFACVEAIFPISISHKRLRDFRIHIEKAGPLAQCEVIAVPLYSKSSAGAQLSKKKISMAVFDMDSTLIEQEVIDEIARTIGVMPAVAEITERAMRGELDFAQSLVARVALLKGVRADVWTTLRSRITFANGARELCAFLKSQGVKMAVLSGGFTPMAQWVASELELDFSWANYLATAPANSEFDYEHLTGRLVEEQPIVTAALKKEIMQRLGRKWNIPLSECLCVGDGANDLAMINEVGESGGLGVAFKAKPKVQTEASNRLNSSSLLDLTHAMGWTDDEMKPHKEED